MTNAVDQLCPNCGLCCDGTIFADVELRAGDDTKRLENLGMSIQKKKNEDEEENEDEDDSPKMAFTQPCACFDGKLCNIYGERPKHCRLFECGLLKRLNAGEVKASEALKKIFRAKALVTKVQDLLTAFEGDVAGAALSERYARAMQSPVNLAAGNAGRHGELMRVYGEWMNVVRRDFLK